MPRLNAVKYCKTAQAVFCGKPRKIWFGRRQGGMRSLRYLIGVADAGFRTMQTTGLTELERDARVYRRDRENCAEQTKWHERRFAAA